MLVRFEDLISNTEATIKAICQFLEIVYDPQIITYYTDINFENQPNAFKRYHQGLNKPLDSGKVDEWKTRLTVKQIQKIEHATYEKANKYGYQIEKPFYHLKL